MTKDMRKYTYLEFIMEETIKEDSFKQNRRYKVEE